jgi:hypothetical protein
MIFCGKRRSNGVSLGTWLLALVLIGCGPELTEPSDIDISGQWASTDAVGPITDIQIDIVQAPNGAIEGQWSGKSSAPDAACPPQLGLNPASRVFGSNTVLGVEFELLAAGHFHGQVIGTDRLEGSVESCGVLYQVEFSPLEPDQVP